jgi:hypothetical protein
VAISQHGTSVLFTSHPQEGLVDLFTNVAGDTILQFLKEIDLYTKI